MANRRAILVCTALFTLICGSQVARTQSAETATPQFEVASVKQNLSETDPSGINHRLKDRFTATNVPLFFIILDAYEVKGHQLIGAPDWTWNKSYDVVGTFPGGKRPPAKDIRRDGAAPAAGQIRPEAPSRAAGDSGL